MNAPDRHQTQAAQRLYLNLIGGERNKSYEQVSTGLGTRLGFPVTEFINVGTRYSLVLDKITLDSKTDKRVYRFYTTEKAARTAFKLAEVDVLEDITDPGELVTWNNVTIDRSRSADRVVMRKRLQDGLLLVRCPFERDADRAPR